MDFEDMDILAGVNPTVQDLLRQNARIQDLYFNISEIKLSIISLYIISDAPMYDITWTENRDIEVQILVPYVLAQKILDRETQTLINIPNIMFKCVQCM